MFIPFDDVLLNGKTSKMSNNPKLWRRRGRKAERWGQKTVFAPGHTLEKQNGGFCRDSTATADERIATEFAAAVLSRPSFR